MIVRCAIGPVSVEHLTAAVTGLLAHHPPLRARFVKRDGRWRQESVDGELPLILVRDLPPTASIDWFAAQRADLVAELRARSSGRVAVALLRRADGSAELLFAVDELAADPASVRTLLRDLTTGHGHAASGRTLQLPRLGASFAEALAQLGNRNDPEASGIEIVSLDVSGMPSARLAAASGMAAEPDRAHAVSSTVLTAKATSELIEATTAQRVSVEEFLLVCLAQSSKDVLDGDRLVVEVERSLRGEGPASLALADTVGPLHYTMPLSIAIRNHQSAAGLWREAKEDLRPALRAGSKAAGASYTSHPDANSETVPTVRFAYLGDLSCTVLGAPATHFDWERCADDRGRPPLLRAFLLNGVLHIQWEHEPRLVSVASMRAWAARFEEQVRSATEKGRDVDAVELVPSDFPLADLDEASLGRFTELLRRLDDAGGAPG
jgi:hypothetical protein